MKNIVYLQTEHGNLTESARELLSGRSYQALFCDEDGERKNLGDCLECLEAGDTLFLLRENHLADDVVGYVRILRDLASKGVNVWVERIKKMFSSESSLFSTAIGAEEAEAFERLSKSDLAQKASEIRETWGMAGRGHKSLSESFESARKDWLRGKTTSTEAASRCGMTTATFRKWAKRPAEKRVEYGCVAAG